MRLGPPMLYLATAGGVALTTRAILHPPAPLDLTVAYLAGYVGVVLLGVGLPQLQMWGEIICEVPGATGVALTFDDGPHREHTLAVADALEKRGARATFFAIGEKTDASPGVLEELVERGHEVGAHGYRRDRLLSLRTLGPVRDDLRRSVEAIERDTGVRPTMFRPPYGLTNPRIVRACHELDLDIIGWSTKGIDGVARTTADDVVRRVVPSLRDGAIICLHDAAEFDDRRPVARDALPRLLDALDARNLRCVTVSSLLGDA